MFNLSLADLKSSPESLQSLILLLFFSMPFWFVSLYLFAPEFYSESKLYESLTFCFCLMTISNIIFIILILGTKEKHKLDEEIVSLVASKGAKAEETNNTIQIIPMIDAISSIIAQIAFKSLLILLLYLSYRITGCLPYFLTYCCIYFGVSIFATYIMFRNYLLTEKRLKYVRGKLDKKTIK